MTDQQQRPRHAVLVDGIKATITAKNDEQVGILAIELIGEFFDLQHRHTVATEAVAQQLAIQTDLLRPVHICGEGDARTFPNGEAVPVGFPDRPVEG